MKKKQNNIYVHPIASISLERPNTECTNVCH